MSSVSISVCLSDIPKDMIFTSEKTGKKYISLFVGEKKEIDQFGHTHFVKVDIPKDKRQEGVNFYVGSGKAVTFEKNGQVPPAKEYNPVQKIADTFNAKPVEENDDDLPF